jgi:PDZ domain-containing protein
VRATTVRRVLVWTAGILLSLAIVASAVAWVYPSDEYLFIPDEAQLLGDRVKVEGGKQDAKGGIYYVDVKVRRARWLERLLPFARPDGTSLVPEHALVSPGTSFEDRRRLSRAEMARSEDLAAAVALRAAGYKVRAAPHGAIVVTIEPSAPAAKELRPGDVIVEAAGRPVKTSGDLRDAVGTVDPGESIELRLRRDGALRRVTVRTIAAPDEPGRPLIGIQISQAAQVVLPIDVEIDLGDVGGPSAGLPFALDVLQELGRDVDRGYKVAATGEIELDGTVVPIGGIKQKVHGVRQAGADVFLVPAGDNAREARRYAGNLRVIGVENFQQALRALATLPRKG